jgi:hypothetical protein
MMKPRGFTSITKATDKQLANARTGHRRWRRSTVTRSLQLLKSGSRTVKASGKTTEISVSSATIRAKEYEAFAKAVGAEQTKKECSQATGIPRVILPKPRKKPSSRIRNLRRSLPSRRQTRRTFPRVLSRIPVNTEAGIISSI